jgi:tripartite-type tricarboxylate transporter receptor subunit TctC
MAAMRSPRRSGGLVRRRFLSSSIAVAAAAATARAQTWPDKPIQLVVPLGPGGINDITSRLIAQRLTERLGQSVVVVNKPGAGGIIGSEMVAKATPDGTTILMVYSSHMVNPSLYAKLPYDTVHDFAPITLVNTVNLVLTASPKVPANSVRELIELAKAKPGQLNYGTVGVGSLGHLAGLRFVKAAGLDVVQVPYKSAPEVMTALLSGDAAFYFDSPITALPFITSGRIKALAVTSRARSPVLPEVPSLAEAVLPDFDVVGWNGLVAPARTPPAVIDRLNAEVVAILRDQQVASSLAAQGVDVVGNTPQEFARIIEADIAKWRDIIREAGIKLD